MKGQKTSQFPVLKLNGKEYRLQWDFNSLLKAYEETGVNILTAVEYNPSSLRATFFAFLLSQHPEITLEEAGALIQPRTLRRISEACNETWAISLAEDVEAA